MTIIDTFKKPEYWYVVKDMTHNKWEFFEKWFREKGRISDDYNGHWAYFTHDQDGYNILPNKPKDVKEITIDQLWEQPKDQKTLLSCNPTGWTPTPGEMIEVSGDGEKWEKEPRKFIESGEKSIWYWCECDGYERWLYVRPIPIKNKTKLLELLPEYKAPQRFSDGGRHKVGGPTEEQKQIELLTERLNSVINHLNK